MHSTVERKKWGLHKVFLQLCTCVIDIMYMVDKYDLACKYE